MLLLPISCLHFSHVYCRFRWVFCQLVYLRRCIPAHIRRALNELPETLDETYARALKEIDKPNWEYAHRLFQCVAAASRPFSVEELAEFLAFDFDAGQTPEFLADWRPEDPTHTLLSTCSSLLTVFGEPIQRSPSETPDNRTPTPIESSVSPSPSRDGVSPIIPPDLGPVHGSFEIPAQVYQPSVPMNDEIFIPPEPSYSPTLGTHSIESSRQRLAAQFAHFSVKEYLTSARLAEEKDTISRFHVSMTAAHTIIAQVCLGVLLHFDENITKESLKKFPLAEYAAKHWMDHALFENVASNVLDGMKRLFDPSKNHFSVWVWMFDAEHFWTGSYRTERPGKASATPLHYAAFINMHDIARFLIVEHSQDVNARSFGEKQTPLHVSSWRGHVEITRVLLEHGADSEARNEYGYSPLYKATESGHVELVQVLLEYGADANARGYRGCRPLYLASYSGYLAIMRMLLKHGADVKAQDEENETPLHWAREEEVARLLLEHGAGVNAMDIKNRTPLHLASERGFTEVVRVLLEHGVDANAQDKERRTPLHQTGSGDVAELLLEHGANASALDIENRTPLHRVSERGRPGAVQVLLEHGVDANAQDKERRTPLHQARSGDVARLLLEHGADANALDIENRTPLHHVSNRGRPGAVQVLLEHGVHANARDTNNATPLHLASGSEWGYAIKEPLLDVVRFLLQHGSDIHARDDSDQTPFMRATAKGYHKIMQLLLEHGAEDHRAL